MTEREIKIIKRLQQRLAKLEDRAVAITKMLDELEEIETEEISGKSTMAYQVLKKELEMLTDEQKFIEDLLNPVR